MKASTSLSRRHARQKRELLTRTARWRVRHGTLLASTAALSEATLRARAGFLNDLVAEVAQAGLNRLWSHASLDALLQPQLPAFAYRALEKACGRLQTPEDVYLDSRCLWLAEEVCGRTLRSTAHQRGIISALLAGQEAPAGTDKVSLRNAHRAIKNVIKERKIQGEMKCIPTDFFEVRPEAPQLTHPFLPLACADKQLASITVNANGEAELKVKLPLLARPSNRSDYAWHVLTFPIPEDTQKRLDAGGVLRLPTLRVQERRLLADFPVEFPAPVKATKTPKRVLALDWGERRLLTASVVERVGNSTREIAGPFVFEACSSQAKMGRQRALARHLRTIQDRIAVFGTQPQFESRLAQLECERTRIWEARAGLQNELAHRAARWATALAITYDCQAVAFEDLKTLEPKLRGRDLRDRLSHQIRGFLFKHLADKCAAEGLALIEVNPKDTSALCPRCGGAHTHVQAPDCRASGRGWALCPHCSSSLDRDYAAALRIGSKAVHDPLSTICPKTKKRAPTNRALSSEAKQTPPLASNFSRQRSQRAGSRVAVAPAAQPVTLIHWRDETHCVTRTRPLCGYALARASTIERPHLALVDV